MMPHIHELARLQNRWQRDLNRSVLIIGALLVIAVLGLVMGLIVGVMK